MAAITAVCKTGPFLALFSMTALKADCPTSMMPEAVAIRVVSALSPTSTILGLFCSSKCVKFTVLPSR